MAMIAEHRSKFEDFTGKGLHSSEKFSIGMKNLNKQLRVEFTSTSQHLTNHALLIGKSYDRYEVSWSQIK